jgi:hypothetical protein
MAGGYSNLGFFVVFMPRLFEAKLR